MNKPVHPRILDEEFQDYQTLLNGMEIDPTPITLPCLPLLGPAPSTSGQNKRIMTSPEISGEEETRDTAASSSGTIPPGAAPGTVTPLMPATIIGGAAGEPAN
jgi:hypothetical protein